MPAIITPKLLREKEPLNTKVTEEQRILEVSRKHMIDLLKARKALGGEISLPRISAATTGSATPKYETLNKVLI